MTVKIEKNIAMPMYFGKYNKYPFGKMAIGDSFLIDQTHNVQSVRQAASHYAKRNNRDWKFSILKTADGYRCWRIK